MPPHRLGDGAGAAYCGKALLSLVSDKESDYNQDMVDHSPTPDNSCPLSELEQRFKEHLLRLGLLTEITPPLPEDAVAGNRQLLARNGTDANPVSDLVIKERR
jgi:hypothetical protein